ncbi:MAG: type IX secretion system membrane protein PorP/SprF [Bacteroidaceae bacterium]|nr:type IX secretion system membrane protein PorP/SprF [Bacteroidaceae bacterium]
MRKMGKKWNDIARMVALILTTWLTADNAFGQMDVQFSDFTSLRSYYNPAAAGTDGLLSVHLAYSMQMAGFEDAPKTMYAGADCPIYFLSPRHGGGASLMSDNAGIFRTQKIAVQYAYNLPIGKKGRLAIGVQPSLLTETIDPKDLELDDPNDPAFPKSEISGNSFDLGAGLFFHHPKFWVGASMQHIMSPQIELGETNFFDFAPSYYFMGGCNIKLKNPFLSLQPSFMVMSDLDSWREDIQCKVTYNNEGKQFWGGVGYSPDISTTFMIGGNFQGISLGYSYQMYTNGINMANGTHEIVLSYQADLDLFKKGRNKHKAVRIL